MLHTITQERYMQHLVVRGYYICHTTTQRDILLFTEHI